jgi:hypothetical protein
MAKKTLFSVVLDKYSKGGTHKIIMLMIAELSAAKGYAFPSVGYIAKTCCVSERQAQYVLKDLIDSGFLLVINNENGGGGGATRHYQVNISQLENESKSKVRGEVYSTLKGEVYCTRLVNKEKPRNRDAIKPPIQGGEFDGLLKGSHLRVVA